MSSTYHSKWRRWSLHSLTKECMALLLAEKGKADNGPVNNT